MFGIGVPELIILFIIAAIIIGPVSVAIVVLIIVHGKKKDKIHTVKVQPPPLPKKNDIKEKGF